MRDSVAGLYERRNAEKMHAVHLKYVHLSNDRFENQHRAK